MVLDGFNTIRIDLKPFNIFDEMIRNQRNAIINIYIYIVYGFPRGTIIHAISQLVTPINRLITPVPFGHIPRGAARPWPPQTHSLVHGCPPGARPPARPPQVVHGNRIRSRTCSRDQADVWITSGLLHSSSLCMGIHSKP